MARGCARQTRIHAHVRVVAQAGLPHPLRLVTIYWNGWSRSIKIRIKDLEAENGKLKRMYAELALENTAIRDVLSRKL